MDEHRNAFRESFEQIRADDALKERTKAYLSGKTNGYRHSLPRPYRRVALVACLVLLLLAGGGYSSFFTQTTTISVDVNPSVELGINRYDRVISVRAFNEDGNELLASKNIRFLDYREALRELLGAESMTAEDALVDITVFGTNDEKSDEILKNLENSTAHYDNVHCFIGSSEMVGDAHSHGMSCGKYQAFLELQELDPSVTPEEVQNLTMRQIRDRISELSGGAEDNTPAGSKKHETEHNNVQTSSTESTEGSGGNGKKHRYGGGHHGGHHDE